MRFRFSRGLVILSLVLAAAGFGGFWFTPTETGDIYGGVPQIADIKLRYSTHILQNEGFAIGYNEWYREPLWVAFRAAAVTNRKASGRPDGFEVDSRTLMRVSSEDYRGSGYDRGHLAPNYLIAGLYGPRAQAATFRMSNIAPQTPRLNQLLWQRIEEAEADIVAPRRKSLWVITGPVFEGAAERLASGVAVPAAFFRIWLDEAADGRRHALAFVVPQSVRGDEPLSQFVVTVRDLEHRVGMDFFSQLPLADQDQFENVAANGYWQLASFERAPARYAEKFRDRRQVWRRRHSVADEGQ